MQAVTYEPASDPLEDTEGQEEAVRASETIDFEPESQGDAFALLSHAKPVAQSQDAQSDTAQSIGPRIGSTLAETPKASPEDLVLSALESSLGLQRIDSGAESIQEVEEQRPSQVNVPPLALMPLDLALQIPICESRDRCAHRLMTCFSE